MGDEMGLRWFGLADFLFIHIVISPAAHNLHLFRISDGVTRYKQ